MCRRNTWNYYKGKRYTRTHDFNKYLQAFENAEEYVVMLYWGDGTYIGDIYYGSETSATIFPQLEAGEYMVTVLSRAEGWENGGSDVFFTVTGEFPASPVLRLAIK